MATGRIQGDLQPQLLTKQDQCVDGFEVYKFVHSGPSVTRWLPSFPIGNGRHARLMTDLLLRSLGREPFTWGRANLEAAEEARDRNLQGLRAADQGDMQLLVRFGRS